MINISLPCFNMFYIDILGNKLKELSSMAQGLFVTGKLAVTMDMNRFQQVYKTNYIDDCLLSNVHQMHITFENGTFCIHARHNGQFWSTKYLYYEICRTVKEYSPELKKNALGIFGIDIAGGRCSLADFSFLMK
jgi:hypothetical protein